MMGDMIMKVAICICVGLVLVFFTIAFNILQPEAASTLALEQFKNPSVATDTALRSGGQLLQSIGILVWGLYASLVIWMFRRDIWTSFWSK